MCFINFQASPTVSSISSAHLVLLGIISIWNICVKCYTYNRSVKYKIRDEKSVVEHSSFILNCLESALDYLERYYVYVFLAHARLPSFINVILPLIFGKVSRYSILVKSFCHGNVIT